MEDYTYHFGPGEPKILGAHMLEVCPTIAADTPSLRDPPARASATGRTRCGWSSTPRPAPAIVIGMVDLGDRFRLVANEIEVVAAGRAAAEPAGRPGGVEAGAVAVHLGRAVADRRRPAPHRAHQARRRRRRCATSPQMVRTELLLIDADTTPAAFADRIRWNQAYYRLAHGLSDR